MDQGQEAMRLCFSTFAGANGPVAETTFTQGRQIMEQGGVMLATMRESLDRSVDDMQAVMNAAMSLGRGVTACQRAYVDSVRDAFRKIADRPGQMMSATSAADAARVQRDLYFDLTAGMMACGTATMQALAQAAQEAMRPLQERVRAGSR
jgi:hypothetical protein